MPRSDRLELIEKIQAIRKRKLVTFITATRQGVVAQIEPQDLRILRDHVVGAGKNEALDIFLVTFGGASTFPWAAACLIREFNKKFSVLVPYSAFSAGTSLTLGADDIVMGSLGTLGPVDPQVANDFNPEVRGRIVPISVEDISGFGNLLKEKFNINAEENFAQLIDRLVADVRPLALGNAYRHYIKARDDARKLLELHMDSVKEKDAIQKIVDTLVEKLYFHGHHITRRQAREVGLKVTDAEKIHEGDANLDDLMWKLYLAYERDLSLMKPYVDNPPAAGTKSELPVKVIESEALESSYVVEQEWVKLSVPTGSMLALMNGVPVVVQQGNAIPVVFQGVPVPAGGAIYDKREIGRWKGF